MNKDLIDGLVALCGFSCAFLLIGGIALVSLIWIKFLYYSELTKEIRLSNTKKENEPRKVVVVKDETK